MFEVDEVVYVPFRGSPKEFRSTHAKNGYRQSYIIEKLYDDRYLVGLNTKVASERYREFKEGDILKESRASEMVKEGLIVYN